MIVNELNKTYDLINIDFSKSSNKINSRRTEPKSGKR